MVKKSFLNKKGIVFIKQESQPIKKEEKTMEKAKIWVNNIDFPNNVF